MEKLQKELDRLIATLPNAVAFRASLDTLVSVYPFNDYEYMIASLLAADKAYDRAAIQYHGQFASLNFPDLTADKR